MSKIVRKELDLNGKKFTFETGELATKANASVLASLGETVVLATVVSKEASPDVDFFPLAVDYEERLYAGGKISTSRFIKREGRPSEEAVLTARLIDRSIRPLFPKGYQAEVQVVITVLSVDQENDPDIVSLNAASCALSISDIPWNGPLAGIRVGRQNGGFILNPTDEENTFSSLDLVLATTKDEVVMVEAAAKEVDEKSIASAMKFGVEDGRQILSAIEDLQKETGRKKQDYQVKGMETKKREEVKEFIQKNIIKDLENPAISQDEAWFGDVLVKLESEFLDEDKGISSKQLANVLDDEVADFLRERILKTKKRIDGRSPDDIRPITAKVGLLPRTHGSGLFQRGETQVLSIATLASPALEQLIEGMVISGTKRYMHHYNFPPFSAGEVKRLGAPGRREIGHGALAERALIPALPSQDVFPYTVRVVSEVLSSAGSTSMAAACGSTLALMDAGVPIKEPVAGISVGLVTDKKNKDNYVTLADIAYQEDAQGDMDFKVAGTKNGVTVIQMDTKLTGVSLKILEEALEKAKKARLSILEMILKTIPASREKISKHAPTVVVVKIDPSKIGDVIGSGGRTINKIIAETGAAIDINDEGTVTITSKDKEACELATKFVEGIVKEAKVGEEYEGTVKRLLPFGAMVELLPGKEGLVHISKLGVPRGQNISDYVNVGDKIKVKVFEIDDQHRINLTTEQGEAAGHDKQDRPSFEKRKDNKRFQRRRY
ncbi:MAG TPA: polyribonucleotide nucleotidyltransferase [Patescibacteria group bacterium]|nr:polyribonucleotide nucleotidyltransferase [Patescibacteria group bacterium]